MKSEIISEQVIQFYWIMPLRFIKQELMKQCYNKLHKIYQHLWLQCGPKSSTCSRFHGDIITSSYLFVTQFTLNFWLRLKPAKFKATSRYRGPIYNAGICHKIMAVLISETKTLIMKLQTSHSKTPPTNKANSIIWVDAGVSVLVHSI